MQEQPRPPVGADDVDALASAFGIQFGAARSAIAAETLNAFLPLLGTLRSVDVADHPPATQFKVSVR